MCEYKGRSYSDRDTIRDNCNTCSCQVRSPPSGAVHIFSNTFAICIITITTIIAIGNIGTIDILLKDLKRCPK